MSYTMSELDRKKADVRKRLQEEAEARTRRKGFLTPERRKKLRVLLRRCICMFQPTLEEERRWKEAERRKAIDRNCGERRSTEGLTRDQLLSLCKEYQDRVGVLEGEKFDLEKQIEVVDNLIEDLSFEVNGQRGRFVKPALKKVHKVDNKFATLEKKAAEFSFWKELRATKRKEFIVEEPELKKPDWSIVRKNQSQLSSQPSSCT